MILQAIEPGKSEDSQNEQMKVRNGEPEPPDNDWAMATMEERIEAVWTLTKICMGWHNSSDTVPELQRTVTRVIRRRR